MKFNLKKIAAAALLAAASLPSFAVINTTATNTSLVMVAFDFTGATGATYYRDLGSVNQILNATGNVSFAAPTASIFGSTFANVAASDIIWSVIGVDISSLKWTNYIASGTTALGQQNIAVSDVVAGMAGNFGTFVALDDATKGFSRPNGEYTGNGAVGGDGSFATNAFDAAGRFSLGSYDLGVGVGTSLNFFKVAQNPANNLTASVITQINTAASGLAFQGAAKGGYFTLADTAGNLTWTQAAAVAAVPLPAGALLLGPGLLAMLGYGRRRNNAA
jgi:hypothetical protein